MNMNSLKDYKWFKPVRIVALTLVVTLVIPLVLPSLMGVVSVIAESNPALARIYGILSESAGEPTTAQDYYEQANISIGQREYDKALEELETARSLTTEEEKTLCAELWLKTASVHIIMGNMEDAQLALDESLRLDEASAQSLLLRAQLAIEKGDSRSAVADLTKYMELQPADTVTRLTLAQLLETVADYKAAAEEYAKLYEQYPTDESHLLNELRCRFLIGEYEAAVAGFDDYITRHAEDEKDRFGGVAYFLRAACLMQMGDFAAAAEGFEQAIAKGYDKASSLEQLTLCRFETAEYDAVITVGEELLTMENARIVSPEQVHQRIGVAHMRQSNYEEAIAQLDKAKELKPELEGNEYYRGVCLLSLGRHEEAVEAFTASLEGSYLPQFCYYNRGVCYIELLEYEKAIEDMAMTLEAGDDPELITAARDILWQLASYFEQTSQTAAVTETTDAN